MLNKQSVMRCISNHGPINRSAIAKMVGLSIPTVMEITDKLLEHGMVVAEMKQGKGQGKRPELLRVCGEHFRFIGVDVGRTTIRIVLVGLDQQIIDMVKYATEDVHCARRFVERICAETGFAAQAGALPGGAARQANLHLLVSRARTFMRTQGGSLHAFLAYASRLRAGGDTMSASAIG